jgi:hypothetical protein
VRPIDLDPGEAILHERDPERCVVLLPGVRYFSQAPLLWFAREAAQARGWSVLELSERAPPEREPFEWIAERAESALNAVSATQLAMIGKSLGSTAAPLATKRALPAVWLTPLLNRSEVVAALEATDRPTLLVGSPADPSWSGGELPANEALEVMELAGLDHTLQRADDPFGSLDVLRQVTERVSAFFERLA